MHPGFLIIAYQFLLRQVFDAHGRRKRIKLLEPHLHDGPFMGHAPTGRPMEIDVFDLLRVEDGRIVEHWGVPDRFHLMVQLGMIPTPQA